MTKFQQFSTFLFAIFFAQSHSAVSCKNETIIDLLIESVQNEEWNRNESVCYNDILMTLKEARNSTLWASWILDSLQLPSGVLYGSKYQLGNYDECMNVPWLNANLKILTKYCLADVRLTDMSSLRKRRKIDPNGGLESYINTITKHGGKFNTITWGVCVPSSCDQKAVSKLLGIFLRVSSLRHFQNPAITVDDCQVAGETRGFGMGFYVFGYLLLTLCIISVITTWYLSNIKYNEDSKTDCLVIKICKSFCMNKNARDLVKHNGTEIPTLHGMRAISAMIIVLMHQFYFTGTGAVINGLDVERDLDSAFFVLHADLITDTFFLMSSLLLAKRLFAMKNLTNPLTMLWKRYIRLIGPPSLVIFYIAAVSMHAGSGPLWNRLAGYEQKTCEKNWWLNLLLLSNFFQFDEICYPTLWQMSTDFHLTILGVLLIYVYHYHKRLGKLTFSLVAILSVALPGLKTYWSELQATIMFNIETLTEGIRFLNKDLASTYFKAHYRMGSYLVGLVLGYFMTVYKREHHKKIISKKWSIAAFTAMVIIGLTTLALGGVFYTRPYDALEAALFAATNRILFAMAIAGIIVITEYGHLPIVTPLLSWSAWVPLSRLSYGLYLVHPALIYHKVYSSKTPLRINMFYLVYESFSTIVIGYILSLVIWLLVEAPINNLLSIRKEEHFTQMNGSGVQSSTKDKVI